MRFLPHLNTQNSISVFSNVLGVQQIPEMIAYALLVRGLSELKRPFKIVVISMDEDFGHRFFSRDGTTPLRQDTSWIHRCGCLMRKFVRRNAMVKIRFCGYKSRTIL